MKTAMIRIGNSRGVRIPRPIIDQLHLGNEVDMTADKGRLIIQPLHRPRQGWEERFKGAVNVCEEAAPYEAPPPTRFDREEWEW
jgi:antitoxin MazE